MLATQLKADILTRDGRQLLPASFRIEELIVLTREIALFTDGLLSHDETVELSRFLISYLKRLLASQGNERLKQYESSPGDLLPALAYELNELIRNELVSRLIGHTSTPINFRNLFDEHFANNESAGQTSP
ncbi:hypothetical protein [Massilia brevitalea]|uniref:hypothetical protein n=1 Tax=Massilia brevitalea TaxID=442526 RepID=UPI0027391F92|nr:hypothetical protein [Massilia brevitalea]